jgi:nucleoside phosphorylase
VPPVDFPTIVGAVKPKQRTTLLRILAAAYSLAGLEKPFTTAAIGEVLSLHYGNDTPANLSAKLRDYSSYVKKTSKGPPIEWQLTTNGLQKLRELSGLELSTRDDEESFGIDVGIVCALDQPELSAVVQALGGNTKWKEIGSARYAHVYRAAELVADSGRRLKVVATTSTSMGLTAASIATTQLIMQFRPRIVLMIGIAAGTKDGGKQFGDVLVADPSIDYNSGKVARQDGIRAFLPDPYPIGLNARLRSVLLKHKGQNAIFDEIRARWQGRTPAGVNRLHVGPLGAADQVIDDADRILEIQQNWRKLIGVEMETYGVYRACHEAPDPKPRFVSFKAVCDFAAEKSDSWQEYAAFVAAQFAITFLRKEWDALWPVKGA